MYKTSESIIKTSVLLIVAISAFPTMPVIKCSSNNVLLCYCNYSYDFTQNLPMERDWSRTPIACQLLSQQK
jgi:hypothetical protein